MQNATNNPPINGDQGQVPDGFAPFLALFQITKQGGEGKAFVVLDVAVAVWFIIMWFLIVLLCTIGKEHQPRCSVGTIFLEDYKYEELLQNV